MFGYAVLVPYCLLLDCSNIHGNIAALVPEYYTEGTVRSTTDLPAMATLLWMLLHDSLEPFDACEFVRYACMYGP